MTKFRIIKNKDPDDWFHWYWVEEWHDRYGGLWNRPNGMGVFSAFTYWGARFKLWRLIRKHKRGKIKEATHEVMLECNYDEKGEI